MNDLKNKIKLNWLKIFNFIGMIYDENKIIN